LIRNYIFPWLSDNDITLSNNGTLYSESTTPPLVQQWLIRQHEAVPAAAPPAVAASATPTPDATDDGIADKILPSLDDLFLTEEEKELIADHIIPWLEDK